MTMIRPKLRSLAIAVGSSSRAANLKLIAYCVVGLLVLQTIGVMNIMRFEIDRGSPANQTQGISSDTVQISDLISKRGGWLREVQAVLTLNFYLAAAVFVLYTVVQSGPTRSVVMLIGGFLEVLWFCINLGVLDVVVVSLSLAVVGISSLIVAVDEFKFLAERVTNVRKSLKKRATLGERPLAVQLLFEETRMWIDKVGYVSITGIILLASAVTLTWNRELPRLQQELISLMILFVFVHVSFAVLYWAVRPLLYFLREIESLLD